MCEKSYVEGKKEKGGKEERGKGWMERRCGKKEVEREAKWGKKEGRKAREVGKEGRRKGGREGKGGEERRKEKGGKVREEVGTQEGERERCRWI